MSNQINLFNPTPPQPHQAPPRPANPRASHKDFDLKRFVESFPVIAAVEGGPAALRRLVRDTAVRGLLSGRQKASEHGEKAPFSLPPSWRWARFTEVATIASNLVKPENFLDMPHVAPDNIEKGTGKLLPYRTIREDGVTSGKHRFYPGQILYSKIRPNLSKAVCVDFEGLCSADMYPLTPKIDRDYLLLFLLSSAFLEQVVREDNRLAMPKVNQEQLSATNVAIPPPAEQKQIVAQVDELMAQIDALEAQQTKARQAQTRFRSAALDALTRATGPEELATAWQRVAGNWDALFERAEDVGGLRAQVLELAMRGRLTGALVDDGSVDSLVRDLAAQGSAGGRKMPHVEMPPHEVPTRWRWVRWGQFTLGTSSGWSPQCEGRPRGDGEWGVLKVSAVSWHVFNPGENKALPHGIKPREEFAAQAGDFLMSRANTAELVGRSVIIEYPPERLLLSDKLVRVDFSHLIEKQFINLYNRTSGARAHYLKNASGTSDSMKNISREVILNMPVPLPPQAEQKRIVAKVDALMALCDELEGKLRAKEAAAGRLAEAVVRELVGAPSATKTHEAPGEESRGAEAPKVGATRGRGRPKKVR